MFDCRHNSYFQVDGALFPCQTVMKLAALHMDRRHFKICPITWKPDTRDCLEIYARAEPKWPSSWMYPITASGEYSKCISMLGRTRYNKYLSSNINVSHHQGARVGTAHVAQFQAVPARSTSSPNGQMTKRKHSSTSSGNCDRGQKQRLQRLKSTRSKIIAWNDEQNLNEQHEHLKHN